MYDITDNTQLISAVRIPWIPPFLSQQILLMMIYLIRDGDLFEGPCDERVWD